MIRRSTVGTLRRLLFRRLNQEYWEMKGWQTSRVETIWGNLDVNGRNCLGVIKI